MIPLLISRELRSLFALPSTWFVFAGVQLILAWFFLARMDAFLQIQPQLARIANPPGATMMIAAPLCNMLALFMMMITPIFTMRLIAEEKRNGTLPLLLSAPLSNTQIVLGKFLGLLLFLLLLLCPLPIMLFSLMLGTSIDHGLIASNLLGLLLVTCSYVALGLYISTLTSQPIIAAIATLAILIGLWLSDVNSSAAGTPWQILSPLYHFQNFNSGLFHSNSLLFFILFCSFFIVLSIRRLANNRLYG